MSGANVSRDLPPHLSESDSGATPVPVGRRPESASSDDLLQNRADITEVPLQGLQPDQLDNLTQRLDNLHIAEVGDPLDIGTLDYDRTQVQEHQVLLAIGDRDAAKLKILDLLAPKKEQAQNACRVFHGRRPIPFPAELGDPRIRRSENRQLRDWWLQVESVVDNPMCYLKDNQVQGMSLNGAFYLPLIRNLADLLKSQAPNLVRFHFPIPPIPKFGKKGYPQDEVEIFARPSYEVLACGFRQDVELFVTYLTCFKQGLERGDTAILAAENSPLPSRFVTPSPHPIQRVQTPYHSMSEQH